MEIKIHLVFFNYSKPLQCIQVILIMKIFFSPIYLPGSHEHIVIAKVLVKFYSDASLEMQIILMYNL